MQVGAIILSQRDRHPSLSIARIALTKLPLGKKSHAQLRREAERHRESRDAATNNCDIKRLAVSHAFLSFELVYIIHLRHRQKRKGVMDTLSRSIPDFWEFVQGWKWELCT